MADDDELENEDVKDEEEGGGKKKKIILFAAIGLVLMTLSIGGTLFAVQMLSHEEPIPEELVELDENGNPIEVAAETVAAGDEEVEEIVVEEPASKKGYAIYFPLKPPIIVNFQGRGRQRFLQADVTLVTREDDVVEAIETHMPMIRNALVLKFGSQTYEEMQTEQGRELLRQESLEELQNIMLQEIDKTGIEKLLFTNLVMQ